MMLSIVGVRITDLSQPQALGLLQGLIEDRSQPRARAVFFVNANTLNLACDDDRYRDVLNRATHVFGDGTGVRWAARLRGVRLKANLNGTDLVPALLSGSDGAGYRYFLLGGQPEIIERAAATAQALFPNWQLAGYHHGYFDDAAAVVRQINAARPDVLLVGMGNPRQERWIHDHLDQLDVRLCLGVGGLFHYWSGDLRRARSWVRRQGFEWLELLLQQPHKWRRYLLGNPLFLVRILRHLPADKRADRPGRQRMTLTGRMF